MYRREGDDPSLGALLAAVPVWARAVAIIGIPGAIALWLVWVGSNTIPAIERELIVVHEQLTQTQQLLQENLRTQQDLYRLEQKICANGAHTAEERGRCFER